MSDNLKPHIRAKTVVDTIFGGSLPAQTRVKRQPCAVILVNANILWKIARVYLHNHFRMRILRTLIFGLLTIIFLIGCVPLPVDSDFVSPVATNTTASLP